MAEAATKDDVERVIELLHDIADRVDQRFDELNRRVERYAARVRFACETWKPRTTEPRSGSS